MIIKYIATKKRLYIYQKSGKNLKVLILKNKKSMDSFHNTKITFYIKQQHIKSAHIMI